MANSKISFGECVIKRDTGKAILVATEFGDLWVPQSVIHDDSEVWKGEGAEGELCVEYWWADKNGYV